MFNTKQIVSKGSFNPDLVYQMAVRPYICPKFQVKKLIYVESEGTESFDVSKNSQNKIGSIHQPALHTFSAVKHA